MQINQVLFLRLKAFKVRHIISLKASFSTCWSSISAQMWQIRKKFKQDIISFRVKLNLHEKKTYHNKRWSNFQFEYHVCDVSIHEHNLLMHTAQCIWSVWICLICLIQTVSGWKWGRVSLCVLTWVKDCLVRPGVKK